MSDFEWVSFFDHTVYKFSKFTSFENSQVAVKIRTQQRRLPEPRNLTVHLRRFEGNHIATAHNQNKSGKRRIEQTFIQRNSLLMALMAMGLVTKGLKAAYSSKPEVTCRNQTMNNVTLLRLSHSKINQGNRSIAAPTFSKHWTG